MIGTHEVRIILDRNRNGLDGLPEVAPGGSLAPGVYWDPDRRVVEPVESTRTADRRYVLLSSRLEITFGELVRQMAMGGGGHSGRAVPYHVGKGGVETH